MEAMAAVPAHAYSLSDPRITHALTQLIDGSNNLMARYPWICETREVPCSYDRIAVADPASLHLDQNLSFLRLGNLAFDSFKITSRRGHLNCFHGWHQNLTFFRFGRIGDPASRCATPRLERNVRMSGENCEG